MTQGRPNLNRTQINDKLKEFEANFIRLKNKEESLKTIDKQRIWQFCCKICECTIPGVWGADNHLRGQRHKQNNLAKKSGGGPAANKVKTESKDVKVIKTESKDVKVIKTESKDVKECAKAPIVQISKHIPKSAAPFNSMQEKLDSLTDPVVGLEEVYEYRTKEFPSHYECKICAISMTDKCLIPHLSGRTHRLKYIKHLSEEDYKSVTKSNSIFSAIAASTTRIEMKSGRQKMKILFRAFGSKSNEDEDKTDIEKPTEKEIKPMEPEIELVKEVKNDNIKDCEKIEINSEDRGRDRKRKSSGPSKDERYSKQPRDFVGVQDHPRDNRSNSNAYNRNVDPNVNPWSVQGRNKPNRESVDHFNENRENTSSPFGCYERRVNRENNEPLFNERLSFERRPILNAFFERRPVKEDLNEAAHNEPQGYERRTRNEVECQFRSDFYEPRPTREDKEVYERRSLLGNNDLRQEKRPLMDEERGPFEIRPNVEEPFNKVNYERRPPANREENLDRFEREDFYRKPSILNAPTSILNDPTPTRGLLDKPSLLGKPSRPLTNRESLLGNPSRSHGNGDSLLGNPNRSNASGDSLLGNPGRQNIAGESLLGNPGRQNAVGESLLGNPGRQIVSSGLLQGNPVRSSSNGDSLLGDHSNSAKPSLLRAPGSISRNQHHREAVGESLLGNPSMARESNYERTTELNSSRRLTNSDDLNNEEPSTVNLEKLLKALPKWEIRSDKEETDARETIDMLSQALAQYKLKTLPDAVKKALISGATGSWNLESLLGLPQSKLH